MADSTVVEPLWTSESPETPTWFIAVLLLLLLQTNLDLPGYSPVWTRTYFCSLSEGAVDRKDREIRQIICTATNFSFFFSFVCLVLDGGIQESLEKQKFILNSWHKPFQPSFFCWQMEETKKWYPAQHLFIHLGCMNFLRSLEYYWYYSKTEYKFFRHFSTNSSSDIIFLEQLSLWLLWLNLRHLQSHQSSFSNRVDWSFKASS